MAKYSMTDERLDEIETHLGDDDSGWLIKSSTLRWLIEREVNRELEKVNLEIDNAIEELNEVRTLVDQMADFLESGK